MQGALNHARSMARDNIVQAMFADIAPPADALGEVYEWEGWGEGRYGRMYDASEHQGGDDWFVEIAGIQFSDGSIERSVRVWIKDDDLPAEEARKLAAALLATADEMDRRAD